MLDRLNNMSDDKKLLLINSALEEFSFRGYKHSSLNSILKKANISKGSFYHYFKNKEDFFDSLSSYSIKIVVDKLNKEDVLKERDYIKRLKIQAKHKIEVANNFPHLFAFLGEYYKSMSHEEYVQKVEKSSNNFMHKFINENIDFSLFKDDLPHDLALRVIAKYNSQILHEIESHHGLKSFKEKIEYYQNQLEDIKIVLYKKGHEQ